MHYDDPFTCGVLLCYAGGKCLKLNDVLIVLGVYSVTQLYKYIQQQWEAGNLSWGAVIKTMKENDWYPRRISLGDQGR